MRKIEAVCTNPESMNLKVTAEFTVGEWEAILEFTRTSEKLSPHCLNIFVIALRSAISEIRNRATVDCHIPEENRT